MWQMEFQRVCLCVPEVKVIKINSAVEKNWIESLEGVDE